MGNERSEQRKKYSAAEKVKVVKEALTTDLGVSGVCRKYGITAALYYQWQEKFFEGARVGLERKTRGGEVTKEQRRIETLERDAQRLKDVIAEITSENITLKKSIGDL